MKSRSCKGCLWQGECCKQDDAVCDDYTPMNLEDDLELQARVVNQKGKILYHRYWYEYCKREES